MALADIVKNARINRRLSIRKAAEQLEVSPSLLHAIETGTKPRPKMEVINKIVSFYDLNLDEVCIAATRIPQREFYKIIRKPELLQIIRDYPE